MSIGARVFGLDHTISHPLFWYGGFGTIWDRPYTLITVDEVLWQSELGVCGKSIFPKSSNGLMFGGMNYGDHSEWLCPEQSI